MIKYRIYFEKIEKVEIEKETEKFVWIDGYKCLKGGWAGDVYNTLDEARDVLIRRIQNKIKSLEERIAEKKEFLKKVDKITS